VGVARITGLSLEWVWVAKVISGTVAIAISFYLNRVWVFRAARASLGQAVRFVTTVAVGVYVIQTPLTQVFTASYPKLGEIAFDLLQRAGVGLLSEELVIKTVAFVLATVPTLTFNFLLYRFWVFPPRTSQ
jgi:putative flippase GtrA